MLFGIAGWQAVGLIALSNVFMTFAGGGSLKGMAAKPWWTAALISWGTTLFEQRRHVPASRIGHNAGLTLAQLMIAREASRLSVFVPFSLHDMGAPLK